ncbi:MAG: alanine dehydrogenase, partial [Alphaproteobacteria bacterium]
MLIGVPREIKIQEYRVGLVPSSVRELVHHGHAAIVEAGAGAGIGFSDADYAAAGAEIVDGPEAVFARADMVVKVKEPQPSEFALLRDGQILFTYLHLAAEPDVTAALIEAGCVAIAYETVTGRQGGLPLLAPMSEVAGRMAIQVGAHCLEKEAGGRGVLLGGVPGVEPANVVVIGGGVAGGNAARMAMGLGARVTVLDRALARLAELDDLYGIALNTIYATVDAVERYVLDADLVVGAVLVPGAAAPKLVSSDMVRDMRNGAAMVDI